jgi:hypothetical protein
MPNAESIFSKGIQKVFLSKLYLTQFGYCKLLFVRASNNSTKIWSERARFIYVRTFWLLHQTSLFKFQN